MFILKKEILAIPQSTLTTSNQYLLKNSLQPLYKLLFSSFFFFVQLQSLIQTPYTERYFWLSLVTQLLQNTSPQMANSLRTQIVFSSLTTESIYHLLVIFTHTFSSIIILQSKQTLELVYSGYFQPSLYTDIQQFCKFYVTCM